MQHDMLKTLDEIPDCLADVIVKQKHDRVGLTLQVRVFSKDALSLYRV